MGVSAVYLDLPLLSVHRSVEHAAFGFITGVKGMKTAWDIDHGGCDVLVATEDLDRNTLHPQHGRYWLPLLTQAGSGAQESAS
jgi:hypothetical protein